MGSKAIRGTVPTKKCSKQYTVKKTDRTSVERFLAYAQATMRLQDWTIVIDWEKPCDKDAIATITDMPDSKHATLRLSRGFFLLPSRERQQVLLHELMHCHVFPVQRLAEDTVSALSSKKASIAFGTAYSAVVEVLVDAMADVLIDLMSDDRG